MYNVALLAMLSTCTCINTIIFILHTMVIFNGYKINTEWKI